MNFINKSIRDLIKISRTKFTKKNIVLTILVTASVAFLLYFCMLFWGTNFINGLMDYATKYNLNPIVFLVIYFGSGIFIIPSIHALVKIGRKRLDKKHTILAISVLAFGWLLPYLYVVFWGTNINIWIKVAILLFAVATFFPYYRRKVKSKTKKSEHPEDDEEEYEEKEENE